MQKLLIANRGEIAVRIIRAARELGLRTVAVYSDADRTALYTRLADEAYALGASEPAQSYLNSARILEIAHACQADAVHPGYGFLSENAAFAADCGNASLTFVGPTPDAMRQMGSKSQAKEIAARVGVPHIPSYHTHDAALFSQQAPQEAERLGYPILVKAAAGGGGKGMRLVQTPAELLPAIEAAAREAQQAFGDATLMLEKYIANPRHIEVQVLGDHHGNRVHLYERECSIQRRHQKIIEETPSVAVDPDLRDAITAAALRLAAAVDYTGAGTVEFLLAPDGSFYFLEMNTRLQVEHPITEMVTGIDLVHQQLRIAQGEPLAVRQEQIRQRGHAIECRVYAEDPAQNFLPATGRIAVLHEPHGPGCRIDSGLTVHDEVTAYYDPLLSKLISYDMNRHDAILRMRMLLCDYAILGVTTNRQFLLDILDSAAFAHGETDTGFVARYLESWQPLAPLSPEILALAALGETLQRRGHLANAPLSPAQVTTYGREETPWQRYDGWRLGGQR